MSLMALAAAAIRLFVYQNGCCSGLPPQRIQIALFTAGRRVMARMNDGTHFCGDTKVKKGASHNYTQLCVPLVDIGVLESTFTAIGRLMMWFGYFFIQSYHLKNE